MVDVSIVNGIINQLIIGGHHPVENFHFFVCRRLYKSTLNNIRVQVSGSHSIKDGAVDKLQCAIYRLSMAQHLELSGPPHLQLSSRKLSITPL